MEPRVEGIPDVLHEVEPISPLQGVRRTLAAGQRRGPGTIADQDHDRGMALPPRDQGLGGASLQDRHRVVTFEIDHQGRLGTPAPQREFIHPKDPWRGQDKWLGALAANQGVWAGAVTKAVSHPGRHLRAARLGQFEHDLSEALGLAGIRGPDGREGLDKNPAGAGWGIATEATGMHDELHRPAAPR